MMTILMMTSEGEGKKGDDGGDDLMTVVLLCDLTRACSVGWVSGFFGWGSSYDTNLRLCL